jgi:hypothetical protein
MYNGGEENAYTILVGGERDHQEHIDLGGRIILK